MKKFSAKTVTVYGLLTATAMLFGYVEMLLPMDFIAPGIKVGVANTVCLFLVLKGKRLGAFLVNCVRILLTALLFGRRAGHMVLFLCLVWNSLLRRRSICCACFEIWTERWLLESMWRRQECL